MEREAKKVLRQEKVSRESEFSGEQGGGEGAVAWGWGKGGAVGDCCIVSGDEGEYKPVEHRGRKSREARGKRSPV